MWLRSRDFSPGIAQAQKIARRVTIRQRLFAESMLWHHDEREGRPLMALDRIS
jgi:hypothetical protein